LRKKRDELRLCTRNNIRTDFTKRTRDNFLARKSSRSSNPMTDASHQFDHDVAGRLLR
jgi:hypothetical protein